MERGEKDKKVPFTKMSKDDWWEKRKKATLKIDGESEKEAEISIEKQYGEWGTRKQTI